MFKVKGFSYIEVVVSITLLLLVILPVYELNIMLIKKMNENIRIESSTQFFKNINIFLKEKSYNFLEEFLGEYEVKLVENEEIFFLSPNLGLFVIEYEKKNYPFILNEPFKISIFIEKGEINYREGITKDTILVKTYFKGKIKNMKSEFLIFR